MKKRILILFAISVLMCLFAFSSFAGISNTQKTAKSITVDKSVSLSIEPEYYAYIDYYLKFTPTETANYGITLKGSSAEYYEKFNITDANGKTVLTREYFDCEDFKTICCKLTKDTTYFIHYKWYEYDSTKVTFSVAKHSHKYVVDYVEESEYVSYGSYDGAIYKYCSTCGYETSTKIPRVKTIKLSETSYIYDGKTKKPTITVSDREGKALRKDTDYTVSGTTSAKAVGQYTITVKFKGNYVGYKKLTYKIIPTAPTGLKVTSKSSSSVSLSWNKVSGVTSYTVYLCDDEYYDGDSSYKKVKTVSTNSIKVTGLYSCSLYRFKVVATLNGVNGKSTIVKSATAPQKPEFTRAKNSSKGKAYLDLNSDYEEISGYQIYMSTSKDGKFTKVVDVETNTGDITLIVSKLTKGKTYYFKVRTYYSEGDYIAYSSFSDVRSCKISQ